MSWSRIDDGLWCHPKALSAGNEAVGVWIRCLSYCSQHLTDGEIPSGILSMIDPAGDATAKLIDIGLFDEIDGSVWVHDYLEYNKSREDVLGKRQKDSERKAKGRDTQASNRSLQNVRAESVRNPDGVASESSGPIPSHPIPSQKKDIKEREDVKEVVDYYVSKYPEMEMSAFNGKALVRKWIDGGCTVEKLKRVVDGSKADEWRQGTKAYAIGQIFKNAETIDQLAAKAESKTNKRKLPLFVKEVVEECTPEEAEAGFAMIREKLGL